MLNDIIFQVIVAAVGVTLLNSDKIKWLNKLKYPGYVMILSFLLYKGVPWNRDNFYIFLNVKPNATKQEIQTAYRQAAKIYHPDKNPDVGSDSPFIKLKYAYDVLTDDIKRSYYNRFGDYKNGDVDDGAATLLVCLSVVQQTMFFIIGYFLSYPKKLNFARQIFLIYNIASFCFELEFRFIEDDSTFDWVPYFGYLLPFEKVNLFKTLFPIIFFISICISSYIYTDKNATIIFLLRSILATNRVIVERTNDVVESTNYLKNHGEELLLKISKMRKLEHLTDRENNSGEPVVQELENDENADETKEKKDKNDTKAKLDDSLIEQKLVEHVQKFSLTLDSKQMEMLEACFSLIRHNPVNKNKKKKAWYESFSFQVVLVIIFIYVWLTK